MSTDVGQVLPAPLSEALLATPDANQEAVLLLCSIDEQGWPHPAMLGAREVLVIGPSTLRIALYSRTRTEAFLRARPSFTLIYVDDAGAAYVKARAVNPPVPLAGVSGYLGVELSIERVLLDAADPARDGATRLLGGIRVARLEPHALPDLRAALRATLFA